MEHSDHELKSSLDCIGFIQPNPFGVKEHIQSINKNFIFMLTSFIHSHIYEKMKLKSKSPLLNTIISKVDDLLSKIPSLDQAGAALEDSLDFDQHVDSIKELQLKDETGTNLHPFTTYVASRLVYDELAARRDEKNNWKEE